MVFTLSQKAICSENTTLGRGVENWGTCILLMGIPPLLNGRNESDPARIYRTLGHTGHLYRDVEEGRRQGRFKDTVIECSHFCVDQ